MKKILAFSIVAVALMASCGKKPVAGFSASTNDTYTDKAVAFTSSATDAKSQEWTFGDGSSSTDASPSHSYKAAGDYLVTCTVYSDKKSKKHWRDDRNLMSFLDSL